MGLSTPVMGLLLRHLETMEINYPLLQHHTPEEEVYR
jgi:hypothetical protein